jgi:AAA+ ATPase superfamily predicted ATPase
MDNAVFVGRKAELAALNSLLPKKASSLVVIKGRRRIGKSRLIEEFAKKGLFYCFSGLPPVKNITAQDQRDEFALQLSQQTNLPELSKIDDWTKLFSLLADKSKTGQVIILLDEISWMAQDDPTFLGKLKNAWDMHFKKNPKLILVLCGSISAWIEKNILSSMGYFGRVSLEITLGELSLHECKALLKALGFQRSSLEKLIILSVTGGIPWYLEQIKPQHSALENIQSLCFKKDALLSKEYIHIFHDLFGKRSGIYQKITAVLSTGDLDYAALAKKLDYAKSSALSEYLNELILSGYISQYNSWSFKTAEILPKIVKYRLSDNFLRFYFRYMKSKTKSINEGNYVKVSPASLPGWNSMLGIQI